MQMSMHVTIYKYAIHRKQIQITVKMTRND